MSHWLRTILVAPVILLSASVCTGQDAFFDEGNQLYQAEQYDEALQRYMLVVDQGFESGQLYYNIGNTYFKLGKIGPAILYYERARRLLPADTDVRANLELARSLTTDDITPLPEFWLFRVARWWVELLPRAALTGLVGLAYLIAMSAVAFAVLRPSPPGAGWSWRAATVSALVAVVLGGNLAIRERARAVSTQGIVMTAEAVVQSAPSDDVSLQLFAVHEGTKVRINRRSDSWSEIILEDGKVGWIRSDQLQRI